MRRHNFTPLVYSSDVIPGAEALESQSRLAPYPYFKLNQEKSEMCYFSGKDAIIKINTQHPSTLLHPVQGGMDMSDTGSDL